MTGNFRKKTVSFLRTEGAIRAGQSYFVWVPVLFWEPRSHPWVVVPHMVSAVSPHVARVSCECTFLLSKL